jgi:hypothetical protein
MKKKSTAREREQHRQRQHRYRCRVAWAKQFDDERRSKMLIDIYEYLPFQDYQTSEEMLTTCRRFAFAFRAKGVTCDDIQLDETIESFSRRVVKLWFSKPLGEIMHFLSLNTYEFDPDMGYRNDEAVETFAYWEPASDSDHTVDVTSLAPIVPAPAQASRVQSAKKPVHDCHGSEDCDDPSCLYFSWANEFARRREIEIKNIQKLNDEEALKTQRASLELSRTALPCVSFRMSDDF